MIPGPGGKFSCDCPNYHSLSVCSHSVAVAEVNGKLWQFVEWYRKSKKLLSLSRLVVKDMPKGRGQKGSKPPRKKQKLNPVSKRVDPILVDVPSSDSEDARKSLDKVVCTSQSLGPALIFVGSQAGFAPTCDYHPVAGIEGVQSPSYVHAPTIAQASLLASSTPSTDASHTRGAPVFPCADSARPPFTLCTPQPYTDPSCMVFTPRTPHSSLVQPSATFPWHSIPPGPSGSQVSLPWWQSSYFSHGNQNVQQFVNPPYPVPPPVPDNSIFNVRFIEGNISTCYGCRNKYSKNPQPPDDICLQTEEWREFMPPGGVVPQTRWSNTYYHLRVRCVCLKWP